MTNKILIDVPPIHDDGLKAFEGISMHRNDEICDSSIQDNVDRQVITTILLKD